MIHKHFISGHYVIRDIHCLHCLECIGWRYVSAFEQENKFKEKNYVIEHCKVKKTREGFRGWPDEDQNSDVECQEQPTPIIEPNVASLRIDTSN